MANIYAVNPNLAIIPPNAGGAPLLPDEANKLWKQKLHLSDDSPSFTVELENPWEHYALGRGSNGMPGPVLFQWEDKPFDFTRPLMNFILWAACGGQGISSQHLMKGPPLLRAFWNFHVYYHFRRILSRLRVKLSDERVSVDLRLIEQIAEEYGVDPHPSKYRYPMVFSTYVHGKIQIIARYPEKTDHWSHWIPEKSEGLTAKALGLVSESVRIYTYLLLSIQTSTRAPLVGPNADPDGKRLFTKAFNDEVARAVNISEDIDRYQKIIRNAATPVSYVVAVKACMLPADMELQVS